jgi:hypothetical protein
MLHSPVNISSQASCGTDLRLARQQTCSSTFGSGD